MAALLEENGVICEHIGAGSGPSDEELLAGLSAADLMMAPYNSVTESGSIHLALSTNVPVLGYESEGVRHIINADSMAPNAERFGKLLSRYFEKPWPTFTPQAINLHQKCKMDWFRILNESI
ncbi:hypothetical protein [Arthrobacter sp. ok909]|uniref:hypothetical protein n=1 Tax=Arthrobacter sp. ok909 TaxID=1761746 RepID=UPI00111381BF|nr:hypothetical protein [Arthrobacter sp. ok909]